jgi:L-amino acid N-acyltransferase YncA
MDATILRAATTGDLPAITAIYAEAVLHGSASFELTPPTEAEMDQRMEALVAAGFPYLVAILEGAVIGYAYAGPYRARPAYRFTVEDSIYLDASARGRGVGKRLLATLIAQCEARGDRQMIAVIGDSANHGSIRLHQSAGFAPAGLLKSVGWKHGHWIDSVLMQRPLGVGDSAPPPEGR